MRKDQFLRLRKSKNSWQEVQQMVAYRTFRQNADDIGQHTVNSTNQDSNKAQLEESKKIDTWLFEL